MSTNAMRPCSSPKQHWSSTRPNIHHSDMLSQRIRQLYLVELSLASFRSPFVSLPLSSDLKEGTRFKEPYCIYKVLAWYRFECGCYCLRLSSLSSFIFGFCSLLFQTLNLLLGVFTALHLLCSCSKIRYICLFTKSVSVWFIPLPSLLPFSSHQYSNYICRSQLSEQHFPSFQCCRQLKAVSQTHSVLEGTSATTPPK